MNLGSLADLIATKDMSTSILFIDTTIASCFHVALLLSTARLDRKFPMCVLILLSLMNVQKLISVYLQLTVA